MNKAYTALITLPASAMHMISQLQAEGIDLTKLTLDHACWRCDSTDEYQTLYHDFMQLADVISSHAIIAGTRISIFKLHKPIIISNTYSIDVIEIPDVKVGSPYPSGWEHIELTTENLDHFQKQYKHLYMDTRGLDAAHHPSISYKLKHRQKVKFNNLLLLKKIEQEQSK
ncbi:MAG: putative metalloenzyme YecM [Alphaproteobacteria bacterium]|jgi:predicted metalloenzyme YecM